MNIDFKNYLFVPIQSMNLQLLISYLVFPLFLTSYLLWSLFDCKYGIKTTQSFQLIFHNELYNSFRMQHFVGLDSTTLILWSDGKVLEVEICCECLQLLSINVQLLVMGYTSLNIMLCLVMMMQKWSQTCNPATSSTQHWVFYKM